MSEVDEFLEHYGVKGMKWGVRRAEKAKAAARVRSKDPERFGNRNNRRYQRTVDKHKEVARGKGSFGTKAMIALSATGQEWVTNSFSVKEIAGSRVTTLKTHKAQISAGKKRVNDKLYRLQGVDLREIKV